MRLLIYLTPKPDELQTCKDMAFVGGEENRGVKYYLVDENKLNFVNPIHPTCTCKVILVAQMDNDGNITEADKFVDELKETGAKDTDFGTENFAARYEQTKRAMNRSTFKMAQGQSKPTRLDGWQEVNVEAAIDVLDNITKNAQAMSYDKLI